MKLQQLYSYVRQAIDDYQMIADGDRIAVGTGRIRGRDDTDQHDSGQQSANKMPKSFHLQFSPSLSL